MTSFWSSLNEGQGSVLASLITVIGAGIGVWLGARFFGGKVRNLETATQATEELVGRHKASVENDLAEIRSTLSEIVAIGRQTKDSIEERPPEKAEDNSDPEWENWYQLRSAWRAIRDEIERRAANQAIDGRTRARYGRIDRRQFQELIRQLGDDGRLAPDRRPFEQAFALWQAHKNGRRNPTEEDVETLNGLKSAIVPEGSA